MNHDPLMGPLMDFIAQVLTVLLAVSLVIAIAAQAVAIITTAR